MFFLPHPAKEQAKILWRDGAAVGFYSIKMKGEGHMAYEVAGGVGIPDVYASLQTPLGTGMLWTLPGSGNPTNFNFCVNQPKALDFISATL